MKQRFQDYVEEAAKLWTDALGEPDSDSGHRVDLKEFTLANGKTEVWHDHVPAETLELLINNRNGKIGTMVADLGYDPDSKEQGCHQMYLDDELDFNSQGACG
ncbi:hypothetical protein N0V86_005156 [Didymella sp. IMI 355093]|nr:hypothetical protein N0V86_005156 [Didymella sp. IMI 355093]